MDEFNEDLFLYRIQLWSMAKDEMICHYIAAKNFEDAFMLTSSYYIHGREDLKLAGIWEVDSIIAWSGNDD